MLIKTMGVAVRSVWQVSVKPWDRVVVFAAGTVVLRAAVAVEVWDIPRSRVRILLPVFICYPIT